MDPSGGFLVVGSSGEVSRSLVPEVGAGNDGVRIPRPACGKWGPEATGRREIVE
jgi:hypothetical protein